MAKALRAEIDATLTRYGEPGIKFKNMTWGALTNVADRMTTQAISEMKAEGKQGMLPPWAKAYVLVHPSPEGLAMAYAFGGKLEKMFKPTPSGKLASGMGKLARSGLTPPPATAAHSIAPTPASRMLPERATPRNLSNDPTLGRQAPGGPNQTPPPRVIALGGEMPPTGLARRPGSTPTTHLPPTPGAVFEGSPATAPPQMTPPPYKLLPPGPAQPAAAVAPYRQVGPMRQLDILAEGEWDPQSFPPEEDAPLARVVGSGRSRRIEVWDQRKQRWVPWQVSSSGQR